MRIWKRGKQYAALVVMAAGFFLLSMNVGAQDIDAQGALIRELYGTVETRAPGSSDWVRAKAGDRIEKDAFISTGFESGAVLAAGESLITVRPLTRLSLEEIVRDQDGERINLSLQTGRIRAEVNPPTDGRKISFTVRSPVVSASVRGTTFEFDTENLTVTDGEVLYGMGGGREVSVAGGETSYVDRENNTVISPFVAAAELLAPALPPGTDFGGPLDDRAPAMTPPPAAVGIEFGWD
jgi:hypothetical protein